MEPRYDRFDAATAGMEAGACSHAAAQKPPGGLTCGTATARPRPQKCTNRGQRRKRRTAVRFYRRKEPSPFSDRRTESSIGKFPFNSFRASKSVVFAGGFGTSGRKYDQAVDEPRAKFDLARGRLRRFLAGCEFHRGTNAFAGAAGAGEKRPFAGHCRSRELADRGARARWAGSA